jgi:N-glycosidase YbiA
MPKVINFYYADDIYGEFSNFYVRPITIDGVTWPVGTEQYFHAMKSEDESVQEHVRTQITTPAKAKRYGKQVALRADWDSVVGTERLWDIFRDDRGIVVERAKDHIMYTALVAKFTQHDDLRQILLSTGDAVLVEDTQGPGKNADAYWGNGATGDGQNKLGRMLMMIRRIEQRKIAEAVVAAPQESV